MENKDLEDKKINNEQSLNEGFSGENIAADYNPAELKSETEIDANGNAVTVQRARNTDNTVSNDTPETGRNWNENESLSREVSAKTVEHKDRNSDITANRYPNSHPDNHKNRGNIKTEE